jgi:hypothetical protein
MSATMPPILLDKKLLSDGLYTLLSDLSASLNTNHDATLPSPHELVTTTETLSANIAEHHLRNHRRSKAPLDPANLSFHSLRTHNPAEETIRVNEDGSKKIIKGEKEWYCLVLSETEEATSDVQILAESALRKDKTEFLDGFNEAVRAKVKVWNEANKERERRIREGRGKKVWEKKGEEIMKKRKAKKESEERVEEGDENEEDVKMFDG